MSFSLNEVEATARKATRGAGYPWGVADEAGKAVRWLCARDVDGCGALAALLIQIDAKQIATRAPHMRAGCWVGHKLPLCPLITGCSLADLGVDQIQLTSVAVPVLLLPFLASVAQLKQCCLTVVCDGGTAKADGHDISVEGELIGSSALQIEHTAALKKPNRIITRTIPKQADWITLNAFAHRTYAPATEESRRKGAG